MRRPPPLRVELVPSRVQGAFVAVVSAALAATTQCWPWGVAVEAAACFALAAIALVTLRRLTCVPPLVVVNADARVTLVDRRRERSGVLDSATYVSAPLVSIVWRPQGARFSRALLVTADMLDGDAMRRLRTMLRYVRAPPSRGGGTSELEAG